MIGYGGGYIQGYRKYMPIIRSHETKISNLALEISNLKLESSSLKQAIYNQEAQITNQQTSISALESEKSTLQNDLNQAKNKVGFYEGQVRDLRSELSELQVRMNKISGITVIQHYQWDYQRGTWNWDLPIRLSLYTEYLERPRPTLNASYVDMALDPKDDSYIDTMIEHINSAALKMGYTEVGKVNLVIAFVQGLPYTVDKETKPHDEYPRYPIETLFDRGGDCEDTSILVAALLDSLGYDTCLLFLEGAHHMAVGVSIGSKYGSYYEHDGKKYYYLETTGKGWKIGEIPTSITDTAAQIYPLRS